MSADFVHLHNHSEFSLLDGAIKYEELGQRLNELNMNAFALTDHGNLFGVIQFIKTMKKYDIKPIIGCEVYITDDMHYKGKDAKTYHLVLLVKSKMGYKNLVKMVSRSYIEGHYYKPRIDKKLLKKHSEGLVGMSACIQGEIPQALLKDRYKKAENLLEEYQQIFGEDFYLELHNHNLEKEQIILPRIKELAEEKNVPVVATNDTHYLKKEDYRAHEALLCIQTGKTLKDPKEERLTLATNEFYLKSQKEMERVFKEIPGALENSQKIAQKCNYALEDELNDELHFPKYEVPENHTLATYLEKLCWEGAKRKYNKITDEIKERLEHELNIINEMGFPGYFLIVWDFIKYAKDNGIPVGPGRGSAAGSIVAYTLDITDIDPIEYDLLFERFLNPERVSMPDIDVDIADDEREKVINYVAEKYGHDHVSLIATFGTLKARGVIRDVGRVLDVDLAKVDKFAKMVPQMSKSLQQAVKEVNELKEAIENDEEYEEIYNIAIRLEGLSRHVSKHAAGVVVADEKLEDIVPLYRDNEENIATQFDKDDSEDIGLLKIDFLGLKNLSIIKNTIKEIEKKYGEKIDIDNVDLEDPKVYKMLGEGKTFGVFQFESAGMQQYLKKLKPEKLNDLIAMNALYRPGPMDMIDTYIRRKHGLEPVEYPLEEMEPILNDTYGVIVYQEQVMRLSNELAGFSMGQADILRKAMGKKKKKLLKKMEKQFLEGSSKNGIEQEKAKEIWEKMAKFGEYGFNKSHSASYAYVAFQTAYLKAHYPQVYMAAQLTNDSDNSDRIALGIRECENLGIDVLPPNINKSFKRFTTEKKNIRYSFGGIKNIGDDAIKNIVQEREKNGEYEDIIDFFKRIDYHRVNKKVIEFLIYSGAFDCFNYTRKTLFTNMERFINYGKNHQEAQKKGAISLFDKADEEIEFKIHKLGEWDDWDKFKKEKEALGIYLTGHMLDGFKKIIKDYADLTIDELKNDVGMINTDESIILGGFFTEINKKTSRNGNRYVTARFEDMSGEIPAIIFKRSLEKVDSKLVVEKVLFVEGKINVEESDDSLNKNKNIKMFINNIYTEEEIYNSKLKALHIDLNMEEINEKLINNLKNIFKNNQGRHHVYFHLKNKNKKIIIKTGKKYSINLNDNIFAEVKKYVDKKRCYIDFVN